MYFKKVYTGESSRHAHAFISIQRLGRSLKIACSQPLTSRSDELRGTNLLLRAAGAGAGALGARARVGGAARAGTMVSGGHVQSRMGAYVQEAAQEQAIVMMG
jgi:hypothetical protein